MRRDKTCQSTLGPLWGAEVLLVLGAATALELWLAWAFFAALHPAQWLLAGHVALIAVLAVWRWGTMRRGRQLKIAELFILATAVLGPVGAIGAVWSGALEHFVWHRTESFESWWESMMNAGTKGKSEALFDNLVSGQEQPDSAVGALSFTDLIKYGDRDEKHALIMLIAKDFKPVFAPALRLAMRDPFLRAQAAIAIAKIDGDYVAETEKLSQQAKARPSDFATHLKLAQHLDAYAHLGLWDDARTKSLRHQALAVYRHCLNQRPGDAAVATSIGRLLCRSGRMAEAAEMLRPVVYGGGDALSSVSWYGECLFRLGHFDELHHLLKTTKYLTGNRNKMPRELQVVTELWGQGGVPHDQRAVA
jgi:hypothetical protein